MCVCAFLCVCVQKFVFMLVRGEKVTKKRNEGERRLKERCVGLSFLSASKRKGLEEGCTLTAHQSHAIYLTVSNGKDCIAACRNISLFAGDSQGQKHRLTGTLLP